VDTPAEPFLKVADWVLVHGIDMIDLVELFNVEAAAARATAGSAKHEEVPLIHGLSCPALLALKDGVIGDFLE
jgi:hypothetical protein